MHGKVLIDGMPATGKTTLALDMISGSNKKKIVIGMIEASTAIRNDDMRIVTADKLKDVTEFKTLVINPIQRCHTSPEEEDLIYRFVSKYANDEDVLIVIDEAPNAFSAHLVEFITDETALCDKVVTMHSYNQLMMLNGTSEDKVLNEMLKGWTRIHIER